MLMRKPKNKKFEYEPRYYKPEKDEEERRKRRLNFRTGLKSSKGKSTIYYLTFVLILIYIIIKIGGF